MTKQKVAQKNKPTLYSILWIVVVLAISSVVGVSVYLAFDRTEEQVMSCAMACEQLAATEFHCNEPEIAGVVLWTECMCVTDASPSEEIGPVGELVTLTDRVYDIVCETAQKEGLHRRNSWYDW